MQIAKSGQNEKLAEILFQLTYEYPVSSVAIVPGWILVYTFFYNGQ